MQDLGTMLSRLKRPRMLVRAARIGADDYERTTHLARLLDGHVPARAGDALMRLIEIEAEIEAGRRAMAATYSVASHVDVLIALLGEARRLERDGPGPGTDGTRPRGT